MSIESEIRKLAASIPEKRPYIRGEESTKDALIRPMIRALGYDTWNPAEVSSEFTADFGTKQHEKVDFAIMAAGRPIILIECKTISSRLGNNEIAQLFRYFSVTEARFAILTNGVEYRFYTDLRKRNVMDNSPFLVVNMLALEERQVAEICRFAKHAFDERAIWDLAHTREVEEKELKTITDNITREFESPSRDLVRLLARGVLGKGVQRKAERERVTSLTKRALDKFQGIETTQNDDDDDKSFPTPDAPDFSVYYGWNQLVSNKVLFKLFEGLCDYVNALNDEMWVKPITQGFSVKRNRTGRYNLLYIWPSPRETCLTVQLRLDLKGVSLKEGFTRDISHMDNHGPYTLHVSIRNQDDLERAKPLLKRSYDEIV